MGGASGGGGRATRAIRLLLLLVLALAAVEYLFGGILESSPLKTYLYTPIYNATQPSISDLRLVSMKDMMTTNEAYELQDFSFICKRHIEAAGNVLTHQWIPTVQAFFLQVPSHSQSTRYDSRKQKYVIDHAKLDVTEPVDTPFCSAKELASGSSTTATTADKPVLTPCPGTPSSFSDRISSFHLELSRPRRCTATAFYRNNCESDAYSIADI